MIRDTLRASLTAAIQQLALIQGATAEPRLRPKHERRRAAEDIAPSAYSQIKIQRMELTEAQRLCTLAQTVDASRFSAIYEIAGADAQRCTRAVAAAAKGEDGSSRIDQFWARASVRAFFALLEAITFEMRTQLRQAIEAKIFDLPLVDTALLVDQSFELDDTGRPQARPRFLAIERNLRFVFPRYAALYDATARLDTSGPGWQHFLKTIRVRNRITHPKAPEDLELTSEEVTAAMLSISWYSETMTTLLNEIEALMNAAANRVQIGP